MNHIVKVGLTRAFALIAIAAVVMLAAGCGSGGKNTLAAKPSSPTGGPSASPTPGATPSPSPTPGPSPTPTPGPSPTPVPTPTPSPTPSGPQRGKVVVVVEENHGFSSVIGSSAMPYLNSLAAQYGLATQYYADTHPSIGNYFMMTCGQIITNNDGFSGTVSADNIVRHLLTGGKTWKSYAESIPSVGYTGGDTGLYARKHNPVAFYSDVVNSSVQKMNLVPFTQFATDLSANQMPDFSFVVPNLQNDAHDGSLAQADAWLKTNIAPLLANPQFQQNGLLIIVFDEAEDTDSAHGGGHIAMVAVGPLVKHGFQSSVLYQHENLLKTVAAYLGIDGNIGNAAGAAPMSDLIP
ncbi:MAG TPA: alkaline phosphatase family protein [Candidatus Angelobacter sp.]|nr:alkaline phosphatase family protein [Candidatus Angelobacter sp.]